MRTRPSDYLRGPSGSPLIKEVVTDCRGNKRVIYHGVDHKLAKKVAYNIAKKARKEKERGKE